MIENVNTVQSSATTHVGAGQTKATAHKDSSVLNNWISTFLKLVDNILSNYGLQNSENQVNELLSNNLEQIAKNNKAALDGAANYVEQTIEGNMGGHDWTPFAEEQFSIAQTQANQALQRPQQELDSFTQLTKDNSSSTDTAFQIIQTVQTIPQNGNSR